MDVSGQIQAPAALTPYPFQSLSNYQSRSSSLIRFYTISATESVSLSNLKITQQNKSRSVSTYPSRRYCCPWEQVKGKGKVAPVF